MTNLLDRRVRKLEAAARLGSGEGAGRLVVVPAGGDPQVEIAKLADRRPDDFLMVVQLVKACTHPQASGAMQ